MQKHVKSVFLGVLQAVSMANLYSRQGTGGNDPLSHRGQNEPSFLPRILTCTAEQPRSQRYLSTARTSAGGQEIPIYTSVSRSQTSYVRGTRTGPSSLGRAAVLAFTSQMPTAAMAPAPDTPKCDDQIKRINVSGGNHPTQTQSPREHL